MEKKNTICRNTHNYEVWVSNQILLWEQEKEVRPPQQ